MFRRKLRELVPASLCETTHTVVHYSITLRHYVPTALGRSLGYRPRWTAALRPDRQNQFWSIDSELMVAGMEYPLPIDKYRVLHCPGLRIRCAIVRWWVFGSAAELTTDIGQIRGHERILGNGKTVKLR